MSADSTVAHTPGNPIDIATRLRCYRTFDATNELRIEAADTIDALLEAAETVLEGLNARIDAACADGGASVPVFSGIAALSDAIHKARGPHA